MFEIGFSLNLHVHMLYVPYMLWNVCMVCVALGWCVSVYV